MKAVGTGFPATIREAQPRDAAEVHVLLRECFGHEYEAQLVARLRGEGAMLVELVATRSAPSSAPLLGHVAFSTLAIAQGLEAPFHGDAFQALELAPGALAGIRGRLRYASAFGLGG